jgi:hypothetical protein
MDGVVATFYVTLCWTLALFVSIGIIAFGRRRHLLPIRQREPKAVLLGCFACFTFLIMEGLSHVINDYKCVGQVLHAFIPILLSSSVYAWRALNLAFAYAITAHHLLEIRASNHVHHLTLHSAPGSARSTIASSTATTSGQGMITAVQVAASAAAAATSSATPSSPPPAAVTASTTTIPTAATAIGSSNGVAMIITPRRHQVQSALSSMNPAVNARHNAAHHHHHHPPPECWVRWRKWRQSWKLLVTLSIAGSIWCACVAAFIVSYPDIKHEQLFCPEAALFHKLLPVMMFFFFSLFGLVAISLRKVDDDTVRTSYPSSDCQRV